MNLLKIIGFLPYCKIDEQQKHQFSQSLLFEVKNKNYTQCESILSNAPLQSLPLILEGFAYPHNAVDLAEAWQSEMPDSYWANIVYASTKIHQGWQIRGGSYAEDVDESAWKQFFECLRDSEPAIYKAMDLNEQSAFPHSLLIVAAMAQDASAEQLSKIFNQAISIQPLHILCYHAYFSTLTDKWGGSHELMFNFVRDTCLILPEGHSLHSLTAQAYSEYILQLSSDRDVDFALNMLNTPKYRLEITSSFYQWLHATPKNLEEKLQQKCATPDQDDTASSLNHYAMVLYVCGAEYEAKHAVKALNGKIQQVPWSWIAKGIKQQFGTEFVFDKVCKKLGVL